MNSNDFIREKQMLWANRHGVQMRTDRYRYMYTHTKSPDDNIFEKLSEKTKRWFHNADGHELEDMGDYPAKMSALYSSSALCVNIFQYFINKPELAFDLFRSCKLIGQTDKLEVAKMQFECTDYSIKNGDSIIATPNIDLVAELTYGTNKRHIIAESKFREPYSSHHDNFLSSKYCNKELWEKAGLEKLYNKIDIDNKGDNEKTIYGKIQRGRYVFSYKYLDATQLLKHLLGAACTFNKDKSNIRLVYLWDDAWGTEGVCHRNEIEDFRHIVEENTPIKVRHITYQELIVNLWNNLDHNKHSEYLNYITDRYL